MDATPVMDGLQHLLAYVVTGLMYFFVVSLLGGLNRAWEAIDISDNIVKFKAGLKEIDDGPSSWLHAFFYGLITLVLLYFAWHFDLSSSWEFSGNLREKMAATTGSLAYSAYLLASITYLPTLIEMFGAKFARLNVLWAQLLVIGLSLFDLFTDRARVVDFIQPYYSTFVNADNSWLMNIAFEALYYFIFGIWWLLASYGFEALFVCFAFSTLGCVVKGITGGNARRGRRSADYA